MTSEMTITTVPLCPAIGIQVDGLDFSKAFDETTFDYIQDALNTHLILLCRNQKVSPQQQVAFARKLGDLRVSILKQYTVPDVPELQVVSNIIEDGKPIGINDAGALWHTDGSYLPRPDMYTQLYALEIPRNAAGEPLGNTIFSNTVAAYEALPAQVKERIVGRKAIHSYTYYYSIKGSKGLIKRAELTPEQKAKLPDVSHPMVRTHPHTGRKCLYVNEALTSGIEGMDTAESQELLDFLFAHIRRPEFLYTHKWAEGDLLTWDNCATQHLATFDYPPAQRRKMHRAATSGDIPV
jgi:taurine dioxygenase